MRREEPRPGVRRRPHRPGRDARRPDRCAAAGLRSDRGRPRRSAAPDSGATVRTLLNALTNFNDASLLDLAQALPAGTTLGDLLSVLLTGAQASYDWERLALDAFPIQDFAANGASVEYALQFSVGGVGLSAPATIEVTLPNDARYKAGSTELTAELLGRSDRHRRAGAERRKADVDLQRLGRSRLHPPFRGQARPLARAADGRREASGRGRARSTPPRPRRWRSGRRSRPESRSRSFGVQLQPDTLYFGHLPRGDRLRLPPHSDPERVRRAHDHRPQPPRRGLRPRRLGAAASRPRAGSGEHCPARKRAARRYGRAADPAGPGAAARGAPGHRDPERSRGHAARDLGQPRHRRTNGSSSSRTARPGSTRCESTRTRTRRA